jgi:hypothetical protein
MYINIRAWAEALIAWAKENNLDVDYYTDTHLGIHLTNGTLYINMTKPDSWRVSTFENGSLEKSHVVVDEIEDHQLRVRRGPVGKLKIVEYRSNIDDWKLMDVSRDIAKLIDGPLRRNFLENIVYAAPDVEEQENSIAV